MTEDWRKEFDEKFSIFLLEYEYARNDLYDKRREFSHNKIKDFIASLLTTRTEQAVAEERAKIEVLVAGMKKPIMVFNRTLVQGGGYPDYDAIIYNKALLDVILALQDPRRGGELNK